MNLSFGGFIQALPPPKYLCSSFSSAVGSFYRVLLDHKVHQECSFRAFLFCFIMMPLFSQPCVFCWESSVRFWFPFLPPSDPEKKAAATPANLRKKKECFSSCGVPLNWINFFKCQLNVGTQAGFSPASFTKVVFFSEMKLTFKTAGEKKRKWNGTNDGVTSIWGLPQKTRMHFSLLNSRFFFLVIINLFLI